MWWAPKCELLSGHRLVPLLFQPRLRRPLAHKHFPSPFSVQYAKAKITSGYRYLLDSHVFSAEVARDKVLVVE